MELNLFDDLVDTVLDGETICVEFDSGVTLSADMEYIGITIEEEDSLVDIRLTGEEKDYLHLILEAVFAANKQVESVNWDEFLSGK